MWCKLVVFAVFLVLLFLLSRLREAIAYYEGGYLASRLLDPVALSARKLKLLLDQRGVSYAGVVEKAELKELVQTSGTAVEGELDTATAQARPDDPPPPVYTDLRPPPPVYTEFRGGSHFYEEVEDCKDSVWVVQVVTKPHTFMAAQEWTSVVHKVARFGVHTGLLDCSLDARLCEKKGWYSPRLVLAFPQGHKAKDNVILKSYVGSSRSQAVLDWVNYNLASRITEIQSLGELQTDWLRFTDKQSKQSHKLRVVLVSALKVPPMFYSVLSVKFTGRARFGIVNSGTTSGKEILNHTQWGAVPAYVVIMPEQVYRFGSAPGEYPNYSSMALFLKTLQPEVNDIFLLSLVMVNVMCLFELVLARGNLFKRLGSLLWHICKWNCLLILLCFPVLGVFQLPYMDMVLETTLKLLRLVGTSFLASVIRADWLTYYTNNLPLLGVVVSVYAALVGILHFRFRGPEPEPSTTNSGGLTAGFLPNLHWDTYANFLFRPISGASPFGPSLRDYDLDAGMEMLIEQMSVPNIWLGPLVSNDYLRELPVWKYTGPSFDSDLGSDYDCLTPRLELSEGEDGEGRPASPSALSRPSSPVSVGSMDSDGETPTMFICEKCRALQADDSDEGLTPEERAEKAQRKQRETDSARAKYVMDSNYKCQCRHAQHSDEDGKKHDQKRSKERTSKCRKSSKSAVAEETYQPPPGMLPVVDCSICLDGLKTDVLLCGLPCKHSFHVDCIMRWLNQYNHLCPLCRWPAYKAKPCSLHQHTE